MKEFWHRLSKRERGLVILTLVIVALFVGKYAVVTPLLERLEWTKSQLESQPRLLTKNLRYLGQRETLRASLEALRTQVKVYEAKLLTGDTSSVSASDLQETVQGLAAREGTQVITTRVLNPEPAGSFSKIGIQMEIGGQIQQVASLIRALEASAKLLVIDEISIRSLFRPIGFPQPQGIPQPPAQNLRVSLTVVGFARAPASSSPSKSSTPGNPGKAGGEKGI
jgi:hypothetical protein